MAGTARLDGAVLRAWADGAVQVLDAHRAELDALNVFPVADSDTGTNLWLTLREGRAALAGSAPDDASRAFARGALVGARGNSGVIVSQYLGELLRALPRDGGVGTDLAAALRRAADAAYAAVGDPVEGTVLTVARAVSDGAADAAVARADTAPAGVLAAALEAGYAALGRTPEQLAPLRAAGVLDAGGWGLLLVLRALADALGVPAATWAGPSLPAARPGCAGAEGEEAGGAFEVMYVVTADAPGNADGVGVPLADRLRGALTAVGDSVAVVGGDGLWQAHVHTDTPLEAVGSAAAVGVTATQVRVRHIGRQTGVHGAQAPTLGLVTVTGAAGLTADLARAGAVVVLVQPGQVAGPELARAVDDTGAAVVLVLAADELVDPDSHPQAQVRDRLAEVQVVAGAATLASLAGHGLDAERLATAVLRAVDGVRAASVDVGADGDAGPVLERLRSLVTDETALVTILTGADVPSVVPDHVSAVLPSGIDVVVLPTGLPGRRVVLGVEDGAEVGTA